MTKNQFKCIHKILHVEQNRHCVDLGSKIYSRERKDKFAFLAQCVGILGREGRLPKSSAEICSYLNF